MKEFYLDQQERMEELGVECMRFDDTLCQLLDMAQSDTTDAGCDGRITLGGLRKCSNCMLFVNTLCNINKYLVGRRSC
jgi:hypothetical protein